MENYGRNNEESVLGASKMTLSISRRGRKVYQIYEPNCRSVFLMEKGRNESTNWEAIEAQKHNLF